MPDVPSFLVPLKSKVRPTPTVSPDLTTFAEENNLAIGSTTGGRHNRGSRHYSGNAFDVKGSGAFDDETVNRLKATAAERGLLVRDERWRPAGQAVWGGPHIHVEKPRVQQQPRDSFLVPLDKPQPTPRESFLVPIETSRRTGQPIESVPIISSPRNAERQRPQRSVGQLAGLQSGVSGEVPESGMGAFRQRVEDPEMSRRNRIEGEVKGYIPRVLETKNPADIVNERITEERDQEAQQAEAQKRYQRKKPEIDRLTKQYRTAIRGANLGGTKWFTEAGSKGASGITEKLAGIARTGLAKIPFDVPAEHVADTINVHAQAMHQAAVEEGADRNAASKWVQDVVGGFIGSSPELVAMGLGVPAPLAFGAGEGLDAHGANRPVVPAVAHGLATGAAFELGGHGGSVGQVARKAGTVGAATTGIELATGRPLSEALKTGATNATLVGVPGLVGTVVKPMRLRETENVRQLNNSDINVQRQADDATRSVELREESTATQTPESNVANQQSAKGNVDRVSTNQRNVSRLEREGEQINARPPETQRQGVQAEQPTQSSEVESGGLEGNQEANAEALNLDSGLTEHPSSQQPRRARNTEHGNRGQFKKGKIAEVKSEEKGEPRREATHPLAREDADTLLKPIGTLVDGLMVRDKVPNMGSISASANNYDILPGIREVPMSAFEAGGDTRAKRGKELAAQIEDSGEINPLIVVVDHEGAYILEGSNRYDALSVLGKKSFPAKVVIDNDVASEQQAQVSNPMSKPKGEPLPPNPISMIDSSVEGKGVPVTPEPSTTSAKHESIAKDREELELLERQKTARKDAELIASAKAAHQADPTEARRIADKVLDNNHSLSDKETIQLDLRIQEVKNQRAKLLQDIAKSNDVSEIASKGAEAESLKGEFQRLYDAADTSGTEQGRAFRARRHTVDQDFTVLPMIAERKAILAKVGRKLDAKSEQRIEEQATKIEQLTKDLANANDRAQSDYLQKQIDQQVAKVRRQSRRTETKTTLDSEFADLKTQFAQAKAEIPRVQASGLAGLDPEGKLTILIGKMARNRVRAGTVKAEALVDEVYNAIKEHVEGLTPRDVRDAISGYGIEKKGKPQSNDTRRLASIRSELQKLSANEDVKAGIKLSPRDKTRQTQLLKQEAELQRKLSTGDFSETPKRDPPKYTRETYAIQKRLEQVKADYSKANYKATRSTGGKITDELTKAANIPKTIKSMGDISAMFRQGGFYALTHPVEGLAKPTRDMLRSFTELGYRNVESRIKGENDPEQARRFERAKRAGVEFTGVDKNDPKLSHHEEGYLGGEHLDYVPGIKQVKDFSERTFVSFLDSQRMHMFNQMFEGMTEAQRRNPAELKAIARLINIGTGRGSLGRKGNQLAPALNIAMFSPRLLASRVQLLNNMVNPVTIARMPEGARARMIKDNVKFLAATAIVIVAAKGAGATVSTDPDDGDFLKIRFGDTVYDTLTGLQQPLRYIINMTRAVTGGETYPGRDKGELTSRFARTKLSPLAGIGTDYLTGKDFAGRPFSAKRAALDLVTPLPVKDFYEAMKQEGLVKGAAKALPGLTGVGVQTYPISPEKATTQAEKLARKFGYHPDTARTDDEIDAAKERAQLRARSRTGEDVTKDIEFLGAKITKRQADAILGARNKSRLQEDVNRLGLKEALIVYSMATPSQRAELKEILEKKGHLIGLMTSENAADVRSRMDAIGLKPSGVQIRKPREERKESPRKSRSSQGAYQFQ